MMLSPVHIVCKPPPLNLPIGGPKSILTNGLIHLFIHIYLPCRPGEGGRGEKGKGGLWGQAQGTTCLALHARPLCRALLVNEHWLLIPSMPGMPFLEDSRNRA